MALDPIARGRSGEETAPEAIVLDPGAGVGSPRLAPLGGGPVKDVSVLPVTDGSKRDGEVAPVGMGEKVVAAPDGRGGCETKLAPTAWEPKVRAVVALAARLRL